jgi:hypothetical protein
MFASAYSYEEDRIRGNIEHLLEKEGKKVKNPLHRRKIC